MRRPPPAAAKRPRAARGEGAGRSLPGMPSSSGSAATCGSATTRRFRPPPLPARRSSRCSFSRTAAMAADRPALPRAGGSIAASARSAAISRRPAPASCCGADRRQRPSRASSARPAPARCSGTAPRNRQRRPGTPLSRPRSRARGVEVRTFNALLLTEPGAVLTGSGSPYRVFTPFWNRLKALYRPPPAVRPIAAIRPHGGVPGGRPDDPGPLAPGPDGADGLAGAWTPGEAAAHARLGQFVADGLASYPGDRDRPGHPGTSRLSPHLHWGEIGPADVWRAAAALRERPGPRADAAEAFQRELAWREFNHHLMFHWRRSRPGTGARGSTRSRGARTRGASTPGGGA